MNTLKKVSLVNIVALVASFMVPLTALANHVPPPVLEVDSATLDENGPVGGQTFKMYFWVRDSQVGHVSAPAVGTTLEIRTKVGDCQANFELGGLVKTLIDHVNFPSGYFYGPFVWDGRDLGGNFVSRGTYCYRLQASATDPVRGIVAVQGTPFFGSIFADSQAGAVISPPQWKSVPISQVLTHSVSGSPLTLGAGSATIRYNALQTIRNGLTLKIMNGATPVRSVGTLVGPVVPDSSGSFQWNGRDNSNVNVAPGTYQYRFVTVDAAQELTLGQGNVVVQTVAPPPPAPACSDGIDNDGDSRIDLADLGCVNASDNDETNAAVADVVVSNITASPSTFSPASMGFSTISFTLSEPARVGVDIYRAGGKHRTLIALPAPGSANNGVTGVNRVDWNGFSEIFNRLLNVYPDDNGSYEIRVTAVGANGNTVTPPYGYVAINNAATPACSDGIDNDGDSRIDLADTGCVNASDNDEMNVVVGNAIITNVLAPPFSPAQLQSTIINFTLDQPARVGVEIWKGTTLHRTLIALPGTGSSNNGTSGVNSITWDGYSTFYDDYLNLTADNGPYEIRVTAVGSSGVTVTQSGYVTISNPIVVSNLVISNILGTPSTFNPFSNQSTNITFNLSGQASNVSATILNPNSSVVHTVSLGNLPQGQNQFAWNGFSSNLGRLLSQTNDNGAYQIRVTGTGADGVTISATGSVAIANGTPATGFSLVDLGPSVNPFNPEIESTNLRYSLTQDADVRVRVYAPGTTPTPSSGLTPIRTLLSLSLRSSGGKSELWNGRDDFGNLVVSSSYPYLVEATSRQDSTNSQYFRGYVSVNRTSSGLTITDLGPSVYTFNPSRGETVTIKFELSQADSPTITVYQGGTTGYALGALNVTLDSSVNNRYVYRAVWNGRNASNQIVANDTYTYKIQTTSGGSTQERVNYVRVDNGTTGGGQTGTGCAGYSDVASNDPLCPAIQFVVSRGIFLGDAGRNTLRPQDHLSRAETAKVLQSAFGYSLEGYDEFRDGDLGFKDLDESQWYMPYMKSFIIRGVMRGYPDNKMRPTQKMKTTELFKIFVEGVFEAPRALANFTLNRNVRFAPFNDTPVKADTKWYLPYADFAERYNLAPSEPYFYPAREITRGKVMLLIYESSNKNVISYGVTNPSARAASQFTYTYGDRSPTYYRSNSGNYYSNSSSDTIY